MPNVDGGHYFLTCLFPVRTDDALERGDGYGCHAHELRRELSLLPVAQQSPETEKAGMVSPFARCRRTHFLRLFMIDQPMFNGRDPTDPLRNIVKQENLLAAKPFDVMAYPWLVMSADFDLRPDEPDQGLASWARGLWQHSEAEMKVLFCHVEGFDRISGAEDFARLVQRCQVETTMSFNDYWPGRPPLQGLTLKKLGLMVGAIAIAVALAAWWLMVRPASFLWILPLLVPGALVGVPVALWQLDRRGRKPFPPAPDSDLPSVLKGLFVQQWFAHFAVGAQTMDDETLHQAFAQFLDFAKPESLDPERSQPPGVIRSDVVDTTKPDLDQLERAKP